MQTDNPQNKGRREDFHEPRSVRRPAGSSAVQVLCAASLALLLLVVVSGDAWGPRQPATVASPEAPAIAPEAGLAYLSDAVRHAWEVRAVNRRHLEVSDAFGRVSSFELKGHSLRATQPSGDTYDLLTDIESLSFSADMTRRLREGPARDVYRDLWQSVPVTGRAAAVVLTEGQELGLGLVLPAVAPGEVRVIDDVAEELLSGLLDRMTLRIARIDARGPEFCHLHARPPHEVTHPDGGSTLDVRLHESRAPGDGRPCGPVLATMRIDTRELPTAACNWYDTRRQIVVTPPEVQSPASGVAWGWWRDHPDVILNVTPALSRISLELSALQAALQPGRGYTLVLAVSGVDLVVLEAVDSGDVGSQGVALQVSTHAPFDVGRFHIDWTMSGMAHYTQTLEAEVVEAVSIRLKVSGEEPFEEHVAVLSQALVGDPWQGPWPGVLPAMRIGAP